ncbi:hypothetical protein N9S00_07000 [Luminiphilus sp.]|nr:hypothetical protein [Luminiphilus sp.]
MPATDLFAYRGFEVFYCDDPVIGHWEISGADGEFETDLDACSHIDNICEAPEK